VTIYDLPALNALLNGTAAVLLVFAHGKIKRGLIEQHRRLMIAAFSTSILFLISYLTYHAIVGTVRFDGEGMWRTVYLTILATHTVLAAAVPVLATITLILGLRGRYPKHRRIARWTYPIWLYVSVTGVVIYFMLYQIFPHTVAN
jgi:uncharacterized membrane protein YozB (DUF420 family)